MVIEINKKYEKFDLGAILNITTGRLLTSMKDVYRVLNYLTGDKIFTHQIPSVIGDAGRYILSFYPMLEGVGRDTIINSEEDAKNFINEQKQFLEMNYYLFQCRRILGW